MSGTTEYMHGTSPEEQGRLARLNDLLNASSMRELSVRPGDAVLDFGSGLGQLTRLMARAAGPGGRVVGIEASPEQLARARAFAAEDGEEALVEFRAGDVLTPPLVPEEWNAFDLAHARFVIEHVTDPLAVVRQMVRSVRPGGRVVLMDDDHDTLRMWPEPPGFDALWQAYVRTIHLNRNDPYVGRRLVTLLHEAGAVPERSTMVYFGGCAGSAALATMVENVIGLLDGVRPRLETESLLASADYDEAIEAFRRWGRRPDAGFWYAVPWAEGHRPRDAA